MRKNIKIKAWILLSLFIHELIAPLQLMAGSGPAQPEMASFTPIGANDMVDPFTGDFSYNIPLIDIEGYPVNIAYNSGVSMEQEASWVGLGWNLNVGTVNRSVRGLPDDFKGDQIETETSMRPMTITKVGFGKSLEVVGSESLLKAAKSKGLSFIYNNYKGFGLSFENTSGVGISGKKADLRGDLGYSLNTLDGTNVNASLGLSIEALRGDNAAMNFGGKLGTGYNTRTGQSMLSFGGTAGYSILVDQKDNNGNVLRDREGNSLQSRLRIATLSGSSTFLPIGLNTYTPYPSIRLKSKMRAFSGSVGGEANGIYKSVNVNGSYTVQEIANSNQQTKAYGYIYSEEAGNEDLKDFNREKRIQLNKTISNLSPVNFTYDVFTVSGQGVSGMFRPFRNDIAQLNDPAISYKNADSKSLGAEVGLGSIAHGGVSTTEVEIKTTDGPWQEGNQSAYLNFEAEQLDDEFESVYFKAAGEKTETDMQHFNRVGGYDALAFQLNGKSTLSAMIDADGKRHSNALDMPDRARKSRAKLFSVLKAEDAQYAALDKEISISSGAFYQGAYGMSNTSRVTSIRKAHHISEITQTNPDGERYVYGIPAYNLLKKEVTYATDKNGPDTYDGRIEHDTTVASVNNDAGVDALYSSVETPPYAHSYLLTAKLSSDYQDVTGNGISPDDLGQAWKFNYRQTSTSYKWRAPYSDDSFMPGFKSNGRDQRGSYTYGEKEMWYLHTIQSKNQVAEFYISVRKDAVGAKGEEGGLPGTVLASDRSYKLDSIVLFNKLDRLQNKAAAIPLKKVFFDYDYSSCQGIENYVNDGTTAGKLTLKKIEITHGRSEKGKQSPYLFSYSSFNPNYHPEYMDRWGNYKTKSSNPASMSNGDYPYVPQNMDDSLDVWASAWSLEEITLPTGGKINITYESDDYAYVQDRAAMEMLPVIGAGDDTNVDSTSYGRTTLYGHDYLYVKRPKSIPSDAGQEELEQWFFGTKDKLENMYFRFLCNIDKSKFEFVSGYTDAIEIGYCGNTTDYLYLKTSDEAPNAISKTAWGYFRENLFEVLYKQPNVNDNGLESVLKGIVANVGDIVRLFDGVEDQLESRNIARRFKPNESFIRLQTADGFKKGGGSRVKQLTINDSWRDLSGEGENATYGQDYEYTMLDEDGRSISSGVASYEPQIGNDENPFRTPIPYTAIEAQGHIPAITAYQEQPFGESFFPSAQVGYSKVTVKNIHRDKGKSSRAVTEHQFYTAKDFPVIVDEVPLNPKQKYDNPDTRSPFTFPFSNQHRKSFFAASQGYSIVLNDMHGKPLSTMNYSLEDQLIEGTTRTVRKRLGGQKYNYRTRQTKNGNVLDNRVRTLTSEGKIVDSMLVGLEYDLAIDSRKSYERNSTKSRQLSVDVIPAVLPPIFPLITYFTNGLSDTKQATTLVLTKTIQQYGLIESVETFTDQYSTTVYNRLYDGLTGEAILTETIDEHGKNEFYYDIPAYTVDGQQRMGGAYENADFRAKVELDTSSLCAPGNNGYVNPGGNLKQGDEVIVQPGAGSAYAQPFKAWVEIDQQNEPNQRRCKVNYDRLYTFWKQVFPLDSWEYFLDDRTGNFVKGAKGTFLEEVNIFHPKQPGYIDFVLNGPELTMHGNGGDMLPIGVGSINMGDYRTDSRDLDFLPYTRIDNMYEVRDINDTAYHIQDLFDLQDTLKGHLEEAFVFHYDWGYETDASINTRPDYNAEDPYYWHTAYNSCYDFDFQDEVEEVHYPFCRNDNNIDCSEFARPVAPFSKTMIRIEHKASWETYLDSARYYLVEYKVRKADQSVVSAYMIEGGKGITNGPDIPRYSIKDELEQQINWVKNNRHRHGDDPLYYNLNNLFPGDMAPEFSSAVADVDVLGCKFDQTPYCYPVWDTLNNCQSFPNPPYCPFTYRLIDEEGNYITNLINTDELLVLRSGNRNQLIQSSGSMVSTADPLKVDAQGRFLGFKTGAEGLDVLQLNAREYKDRAEVVGNYQASGNAFIDGRQGTFRMDSSLRFVSSRHQKGSIETSKDGYMEELPTLWKTEECLVNRAKPEYITSGSSSSNWQLNEDIERYAANGAALDAKNNLEIHSTLHMDEMNNVEAVASNSSNSDLASDNFEHYELLGLDSIFPQRNFSAINTSGTDSISTLLTGANYHLLSYPSLNKLIRGVSHSGNYSLFLKGSNPGGQNNFTLDYEEQTLLPLEALGIGERESSSTSKTATINYSTDKSNHYTKFIVNLDPAVALKISNLETSGATENSFEVNVSDSIGLFNPAEGKYLLSVWVKDMVAPGTAYAGVSPEVQVISIGTLNDTLILKASGPPIDGWQKIEGSFDYSHSAGLKVVFKGGLWGAFFDDFRLHPFESNINTYVYDQYSGRLKARLDENNYATYFDYDEEGIPSQVRRETDAGVITISESRQSTNHHAQ